MIGRVQLMREAIKEACANPFGGVGGSLIYTDKGAIGRSVRWATGPFAEAYRGLDPSFYCDVDYEGEAFAVPFDEEDNDMLPSALIMSNDQGSQRVPLIWTLRSVTFDRSAYGLSSEVVAHHADDGWERLVAAMEKVITDFYDRHQPRGGIQ